MSQITSTPAESTTTWQLDPAHTQVGFAVRHLMISTVRGRFSDVTGSFVAPGGDFSRGHLEASINVASVDTREPQRDAHLRSPDFFDAERYPVITFVSRRIEPDPHDRAHFVLIGDLTVRGVTKEIRLNVVAEGRGRDPWGGERAGFSLTGRINRKEFGLLWNQALETGGVLVGDDVTISIETELVASAAKAA